MDYWNAETEDEHIAAYQELVDTGTAWRLEGAVGREAMRLIEDGRIMLGPVGHYDYWGNYVPSRHEVEPGTKGSPEYVAERSEPPVSHDAEYHERYEAEHGGKSCPVCEPWEVHD